MMIISRTPLRVSFCGGGTDIADYYLNSKNGGCVTSVAIKKYVHVTVNQRFDDNIRVSYSRTEIVNDFEEIEHELVREAMRKTGITKGVEITTIADIPSRGTGLGSSSAVTVGLLNALYRYKGEEVSPLQLANEACEIEIEILGQPIGKQDQFGCALGGPKHIRFLPDGVVDVQYMTLNQNLFEQIKSEFTLLYTGFTRSSTDVLKEQIENTDEKRENLDFMCMQAIEVRELLESGNLGRIGELLHEGWRLKRELASGITIPEIDVLYEEILKCGATGGKLLGAGGGGFILFHGDESVRNRVSEALPNNRLIPLELENQPSHIIFDDMNSG